MLSLFGFSCVLSFVKLCVCCVYNVMYVCLYAQEDVAAWRETSGAGEEEIHRGAEHGVQAEDC